MADIDSNLVGLWKLDETAGTNVADSSGNGNVGTYVNTPTLNQPGAWNNGKSVLFVSASTQHITLGSKSATASQTVSFWLKRASSGTEYRVVNWGKTLIEIGAAGTSIVYFPNVGGASTTFNAVPDLGLVWHHITITQTGTSASLYIDGVLSGTNTSITAINTAANNSYLAIYNGASNPLNGSLDDVRVYSRVLSAADINELFLFGSDITSSLILQYKLDETSSTTAVDGSGSGNNGTYTNNPSLNQQGRTGNKGVTFLNASNHYITGPNIATAATNNVTYSAWIKPSGNQPAYGATIFSRTSVCGLGFSSASGLKVGYSWNNDVLTYDWTGGPTITNNTWTHVCLVIQPTRADVYVNGVLSASNVITHNTVVNPFADIRICSDSFSAARNFNGTLDDVRIYNRALTLADVKQLYRDTDPYASIVQVPSKTVTGVAAVMTPNNTYPYLFRSRTL